MIVRIAAFVTASSGLILFQALAASSTPSSDTEFKKTREVKEVSSDHALRSIRVVTWNIDHGTALQLIGSELAKNSADLCLLQEVDRNTKRTGQTDVAAQLPNACG
jgi:hypothetical protein